VPSREAPGAELATADNEEVAASAPVAETEVKDQEEPENAEVPTATPAAGAMQQFTNLRAEEALSSRATGHASIAPDRAALPDASKREEAVSSSFQPEAVNAVVPGDAEAE
ncbi:unnamed protein product, partial [Symbiodinium pilosum]